MKKIGRVLLFCAMVLCGSLLPHIDAKAAQEIHVVKIVEISKTDQGYPIYVMDTDVGGVQVDKNNPPSWYDPEGHMCTYADFEPGKVYTYTVYFDLMPNYDFAEDLQREGCTFPVWVGATDCYAIETKFICPSPIYTIDLRNIKLPVEGELPDYTYVSPVNNIKPIGSYGWKIPHPLGFAEMGVGETFKGLKEYRYHVQFIAGDNYYFADNVSVTFNGDPIGFQWGGNDSIIIEYDYVCPTSKELINCVVLTDVEFPVVGNYPSKAHSDYSAVDFKNFYWTESGSDTPLNSSYAYEGGKSYTLHIEFEPKADYLLSDGIACTVNGQSAVHTFTNLQRVTFTLDYYLQVAKYTVSFDMMGHGTKIDAQTVVKGEKATKPSNPAESGWEFMGWCSDSSCKVGFSFNSAINSDTIVYAKWEEKVEPTPTPTTAPTPTPTPTPTTAPTPTPTPTPTTAPTPTPTTAPTPTPTTAPTPTPTSVPDTSSKENNTENRGTQGNPDTKSESGKSGSDTTTTDNTKVTEPKPGDSGKDTSKDTAKDNTTDQSGKSTSDETKQDVTASDVTGKDESKPDASGADTQKSDATETVAVTATPTETSAPNVTDTSATNDVKPATGSDKAESSPVLWMALGALIMLALGGIVFMVYTFVFKKKANVSKKKSEEE